MKKSAILFDHQIFQSQKYGGISRYFTEILPRFTQDKRFDFSVFLGNSINEYELESHRSLFKNFLGSKASKYLSKCRLANKLNRIGFPIFSWSVNPDLIHFTYYRDTNPMFSGVRVLTVYDMIHEKFPGQFSRTDATAEWKKQGVAKADLVISISESTKWDLMQCYGFPEEKIKVVYLANSLKVEPGKERPLKSPYLLFVGLRSGYKNFDRFLKSFVKANLPPDFQILTFGGPALSSQEIQLIDNLGLTGRVHYRIGGDQELATAYKHAEAFVFPSTYEGFGIPPLEAMYYGCPVVCSTQSSLPEVVGEAALKVDTSNESVLAEALSRVIGEEKLRSELIRKGFDREKSFSWDRCAQEHLQIYSQLLLESKKEF